MRSFLWELENNTTMHSTKLEQDIVRATSSMRQDNIKIATIFLLCVLGNGLSRYNPLSSCCKYGNGSSGCI